MTADNINSANYRRYLLQVGETSQLRPLAGRHGSVDALNDFWISKGRAMGFKWSTVRDVVFHPNDDGYHTTFWADPEEPAAIDDDAAARLWAKLADPRGITVTGYEFHADEKWSFDVQDHLAKAFQAGAQHATARLAAIGVGGEQVLNAKRSDRVLLIDDPWAITIDDLHRRMFKIWDGVEAAGGNTVHVPRHLLASVIELTARELGFQIVVPRGWRPDFDTKAVAGNVKPEPAEDRKKTMAEVQRLAELLRLPRHGPSWGNLQASADMLDYLANELVEQDRRLFESERNRVELNRMLGEAGSKGRPPTINITVCPEHNGSTRMLVTSRGGGFGSSEQFVKWFGPALDSVTKCTENNAISYTTVSGTSFFGGQIESKRETPEGIASVLEVRGESADGDVASVTAEASTELPVMPAGQMRAHPVDALEHMARTMGFDVDPVSMARMRAICDEPIASPLSKA